MEHSDGGTFDLVITKSNEQIEAMSVEPPDIFSDHSLISWQLSFYQQLPITRTREVRLLWKLDNENFRAALHWSSLCDMNNRPATIEEYFDRYQSILEEMADTFAPVKKFTQRRQHLAAWMDDECIKFWRHSRMLKTTLRARKLQSWLFDVGRTWTETPHSLPSQGKPVLVTEALRSSWPVKKNVERQKLAMTVRRQDLPHRTWWTSLIRG